MAAYKTLFLILIASIVFIACSKDEELIPIVEPVSPVNCILPLRFSYTLQDEMDGNIPVDSLYTSTNGSVAYNLFTYGTMSVNNDGLNDELRFGLSQNVMPDSSFLIVKDSCNKVYYNSRFSASGTVHPIWLYPTWNGDYAPDSLSYHQPQVFVPEGRYQYEFKIYMFGLTSPAHIISTEVDLTRP